MDQTSQTPISTQALPEAWTLIKDTWNLFVTTWKTTTKTSIFFLYMGLLYFVGALITKWTGYITLPTVLVAIAVAVLTTWVSLRLMLLTLKLNDAQAPLTSQEESHKAWELFLPSVWIGVLTTLVVLGASLLLIIPGIYYSLAISFATYILVDQNIRGTKALSASRALVKGRWWAIFGRSLAAGLLFGAIFVVIMTVLGFILGLIFGLTGSVPNPSDVVFGGAVQFVQMASFVIFFPIFVIFQTKLYRALQKTR